MLMIGICTKQISPYKSLKDPRRDLMKSLFISFSYPQKQIKLRQLPSQTFIRPVLHLQPSAFSIKPD